VSDDEQRLTEEARESREKTQELRDESGRARDDEPGPPPKDDELPDSPDEPWAKTSSGDADEVTDDD
jgi:hypothetical protein